VFQAVKAVKDGTFAGGIQQFGLAEKGVGYVYDENNRRSFRMSCARGSMP
jgi:basic membrane protein A and related proteins